MPQTDANIEALVAWSIGEGGHYQNAAQFNLLNTARKTKHSHVAIGLDGIKGYDSYADGIDATVETLHNGLYGGILDALKAGNDAQAVLTAAGQSRWAGSHYRATDWAGIRINARHQIATAHC